jgi:hypothetical protein
VLVRLAFVLLAGLPIASIPLAGCGRPIEPANRTLDTCVRTCRQRAERQCSLSECERGCEFVLDRIIEKESDNVIACVARHARRCTDVVWADCAARIGAHADGGPPAPLPPKEDD